MVINSNDRQHQTDKAKVTKRIRAFAYWHTSMNKDKGRAAFSPSNPCDDTKLGKIRDAIISQMNNGHVVILGEDRSILLNPKVIKCVQFEVVEDDQI